jgi:proton-translocating NADH-quinone oxidoreductase chain N
LPLFSGFVNGFGNVCGKQQINSEIKRAMITNELLLTLVVCVPFFGAFLLPLIGKCSENVRNVSALILVGASLVFSLALLPVVAAGETATLNLAGLNLLYADRLAVLMALVSLLLGLIIVIYSLGYISHYEHRNEYYFMVVLFLAAMMGLVFSRNLIGLYLFWEITAIVCWRLIGFFREPAYVLRADKAFLITVFGALMMLIGFVMVYDQTGTFDLGALKVATVATPLTNMAVLLMLFGIMSKSATLPLHTWLPDAGVAPSPVTALLHAAVLVKIGVYVFARLFVATFTIDPVWHTVVPVIAAVSALVSAGAALIDTDLKRIIAYSTISQIAFIFLGISLGNEFAIAGGILYIVMHGISKAGLFLCAGIVEQKTHLKDITKLGGLAKTMPLTAASFALCAFSVMGIPPFGGFFAKYMVLSGAMTSGHMAVAFAFFLGAILTVLYLFRVFTMVFLGESRLPAGGHGLPNEGSKVMVGSVVVLAALGLLSGLLFVYPSEFVQSTVQQMLGMVIK